MGPIVWKLHSERICLQLSAPVKVYYSQKISQRPSVYLSTLNYFLSMCGKWSCLYFFCFFIVIHFSSILSIFHFTISSLPFLPLFGRQHKMTHNSWRVVKQYNITWMGHFNNCPQHGFSYWNRQSPWCQVELIALLTRGHVWSPTAVGSRLARVTCEMPSSAAVGQVVFLRVLRFSFTFGKWSAWYKRNILERAVNTNKTSISHKSYLY